MLINEIKLKREPAYRFELIAPREQIVFFDIETTGLSAAKAQIYLIGAVIYEDGHWLLRQFFAESMYDEGKLLEGFFALIEERKSSGRVVLISYNGDGFDIPFIQQSIRQYALRYDFAGTFSLDLLKHIKPYRHLAGLESCKLKSVEALCGILREDRYSGGELIYVYEEYLRLSSLDEGSCEYNQYNLKLKDELLKALLLHNAEDISDMPFIMDILGYESLFEGKLTVTKSLIDMETKVWDIQATLAAPLPKGIYYEDEYYTVSISEKDRYALNIAVNVYEGELKSFYEGYKDYYYLPAEDYAVHKSLGEFVDRRQRRQATAKTCYQRIEGCFIPTPEPISTSAFYKEYKKKPCYILINTADDAFNAAGDKCIEVDRELTRQYIKAVLKVLSGNKTETVGSKIARHQQ